MIEQFSQTRRRSPLRTLLIVVFGLALTGCTTTFNEAYTGGAAAGESTSFDVKNARVVLMPLDIQVSLQTATDLKEPRADWTEAARGNITAGLTAALSERQLALKQYRTPRNSRTARRHDQLMKLHSEVGGAIWFYHYGDFYMLPTKKGRMDWTLGDEAKKLGRNQGAELSLFVVMRESYGTAGRKARAVASQIFGGGTTSDERFAFASLVDLRTGEVVWFNILYSDGGDVREAEPARKVVDQLLSGFPA